MNAPLLFWVGWVGMGWGVVEYIFIMLSQFQSSFNCLQELSLAILIFNTKKKYFVSEKNIVTAVSKKAMLNRKRGKSNILEFIL